MLHEDTCIKPAVLGRRDHPWRSWGCEQLGCLPQLFWNLAPLAGTGP